MQDEKQNSSGFDFIRAVWDRRKWVAVVAFAAPLTAAVSLAVALPNIYRSTSMVIVQRSVPLTGAGSDHETRELETRVHTLSQKNLSRSRLESIIERFALYPELRHDASMDAAVAQMRRDVELEVESIEQPGGRATVALKISYRGGTPKVVASVTNDLASFYVEENLEGQKQTVAHAVESLEVQLQSLEHRLAEEEGRVLTFKSRHLRELPEQVAVNMASVERLIARLTMNRDNRMAVEERRKRLAQQLSDLNGIEPVGGVEGVSAQIGRLTRELRDLRSRYTDKHPDVIRVKAEIASLGSASTGGSAFARTKADGTVASSTRARLEEALRATESELSALQSEERRLETMIATYQHQVYNAPRRHQELQELMPSYETARERYLEVLAQYSEARLAKALGAAYIGDPFRIVDTAKVAKNPTAPNRLRILIIGLMAALFVAAIGVMIAEQRDTSFHSLDELRSFTRVPVLVSVPQIVTVGDLRRRRQKTVFAAIVTAIALILIAGTTFAVAHDNQQLVWKLSESRSEV